MMRTEEDTHLGSSSPTHPLLLWMTIAAEYYAGDRHDFAYYLRLTDEGVAVLYVLGEDGPKEAVFSVTLHGTTGVVCIVCSEYEVDVTKEVANWA